MSAPILLIYVEKTGHVVAAATAVAPSAGDPTPDMFVGESLPVRYIGDPTDPPRNEVQIPANQLAVLSADPQLVAIDAALEHFVKPDKTTPKLPSTKIGAVGFVGHDTIKINLKATTTDKIAIFVRIQPQASLDPAELAAKSRTAFIDYAPPDTNAHDLSIPFDALPDSGAYTTLVLVSGFQPSLKTTALP